MGKKENVVPKRRYQFKTNPLTLGLFWIVLAKTVKIIYGASISLTYGFVEKMELSYLRAA